MQIGREQCRSAASQFRGHLVEYVLVQRGACRGRAIKIAREAHQDVLNPVIDVVDAKRRSGGRPSHQPEHRFCGARKNH